jgi:hypothetical protein
MTATAAIILILIGTFHLDFAAGMSYSVAETAPLVDTPCSVAPAISDVMILFSAPDKSAMALGHRGMTGDGASLPFGCQAVGPLSGHVLRLQPNIDGAKSAAQSVFSYNPLSP